MKTPIKLIESLGIPTSSYGAAAQYVMNSDLDSDRPGLGQLTQQQCQQHIQDIIGLIESPEYPDEKTARLVLGYTVQETIRISNSGDIPDMDSVWTAIQQKSTAFISANPWAVRTYVKDTDDGIVKLDAVGNPKAKKGAKKENAKKLWEENANNLSRDDRQGWMKYLQEANSMSAGGSSTYYASLKKGTL